MINGGLGHGAGWRLPMAGDGPAGGAVRGERRLIGADHGSVPAGMSDADAGCSVPDRMPAGLPLPRLTAPERTGSAYYVVTTIDSSGRLADRSPLRVLRWEPGWTLRAAVTAAGAIVVVPQRNGTHAITTRGHLRLPAAIRHASHLRVNDRVLVAADADRGVLVVYPMVVLDAVLGGRGASGGQAAA